MLKKWFADQKKKAKAAWAIVLTCGGLVGYNVSVEKTETAKVVAVVAKVSAMVDKVEAAAQKAADLTQKAADKVKSTADTVKGLK